MKFLFPLTIIMLVLKLADVINWSWWIIFTPVLVAAGVLVITLVLLAMCAVTPNSSLKLSKGR